MRVCVDFVNMCVRVVCDICAIVTCTCVGKPCYLLRREGCIAKNTNNSTWNAGTRKLLLFQVTVTKSAHNIIAITLFSEKSGPSISSAYPSHPHPIVLKMQYTLLRHHYYKRSFIPQYSASTVFSSCFVCFVWGPAGSTHTLRLTGFIFIFYRQQQPNGMEHGKYTSSVRKLYTYYSLTAINMFAVFIYKPRLLAWRKRVRAEKPPIIALKATVFNTFPRTSNDALDRMKTTCGNNVQYIFYYNSVLRLWNASRNAAERFSRTFANYNQINRMLSCVLSAIVRRTEE